MDEYGELENVKSIFQSATFWVNFGLGAIAAADWFLAHQPLLSGFMSPETMAVIVAIANILLRFKAKQAVRL